MNRKEFYLRFRAWTHCFGRPVRNNVVICNANERYYHYSLIEVNGEVIYRLTYAHAYNTYSRAKKP